MHGIVRVVIACVSLLVIPVAAYAQASITGVVRDTSGAVLPGVTVEASSPNLSEKVRTVVTDGGGQYRIITLPPGTYSVTFTLPGFSVVRRDGIELQGTFTAAINADLRVGSLEETVTVTAESPPSTSERDAQRLPRMWLTPSGGRMPAIRFSHTGDQRLARRRELFRHRRA